FGATAVVLFGAPGTAMAKSRSLFGGSIISSFIGVSVAQIMPHQSLWLGGMVAVCLSVAAMGLTDTMHSPGGAMAFLAVASPPEIRDLGYFYVIYPVGTGISIMYIVALIVHKLSPIPPTRQPH
ncbi:MAG: HPP family protein, partial [Mariprofundaceae bacterium]